MNVRLSWLFVAAALLSPASALAQQRGGSLGTRAAVLVGFEDSAGPAALALRVDGEIPQKSLSPEVGLSIVGSIGFTRQSDHYNDPFGDKWEWSTNILKLVPAARFNFGHNAKIKPYADAGVGLYYASWSQSYNETIYVYPGYTTVTHSWDDSEIGLMFRFAGGINFQVGEGFMLGGELGFNPYMGDIANDSTLTVMFGATMRL